LELGENKERREQMDNEVKPTWRLAWGLWWRWFLIGLGVSVIIGAILTAIISAVGLSIIPWHMFW